MSGLISWLRGWDIVKVITRVDLDRSGNGFHVRESEYRLYRTRVGPQFRVPRDLEQAWSRR